MRFLVAATVALLPLAACANHDDAPGIPGSGSGGTRSYAVDGFTAISLAASDDVAVSVGPGFSVRAEGSGDVLDKLRIEKTGDTLRIGRRRSGWFGGMSNGSAKVYVTMPAITAASLAGSGDLAVDRASGDALALSLAGSGNLSVAAIAVRRAEVSIAGSGNVSAAGDADELRVKIAGAGDVRAGQLKVRGADVSIAGSGGVHAAVNGHATVNIMGSGDVDLGPNATCETKTMGSGRVRCGK